MNTFDPDVVVIGGGGQRRRRALLLGRPRRSRARLALPGVGTRTRIRLARYGNDAGVRGAALHGGSTELAADVERSAEPR